MASTMRFDNWQTTDGTSIATTNASGDITFAGAVAGAGKILQVVRATDATIRTTTSTSLVDAGISVTITPSSATSDVIVIWQARSLFSGGTIERGRIAITDSSNASLSGAENMEIGIDASTNIRMLFTLIGFDSPATTSATTYKGRFGISSSAGSHQLLNGNPIGQMFAIEVEG